MSVLKQKRASAQQQKEDRQILSLLRLGDPDAVAYWLQHYEQWLERFVATKVSEKSDVQELVQDIFMSCLQHLPLYRGDAAIRTWMISVARHEIADYYRKKYAKKALKLLPLSELLLSAKVNDAHDVAEQVGAVLSRMSTRSRELLMQKYVDGKAVATIAQEQDSKEKAVEARLYRARNEFREQYSLVLDLEEL
ncbi:MAG: RNA polymerase sigma factor [Patescibacteria group bacterium]